MNSSEAVKRWIGNGHYAARRPCSTIISQLVAKGACREIFSTDFRPQTGFFTAHLPAKSGMMPQTEKTAQRRAPGRSAASKQQPHAPIVVRSLTSYRVVRRTEKVEPISGNRNNFFEFTSFPRLETAAAMGWRGRAVRGKTDWRAGTESGSMPRVLPLRPSEALRADTLHIPCT